jgi:phage-related protein
VLAAGLDATNEKASAFWGGFTTKFDAVDTALGQAVDTLSRSTSEQQDRLRSHVQGVDQGLSEAIGKLAPFLAQIKESAEAIADSIEAARSSHGMTRP